MNKKLLLLLSILSLSLSLPLIPANAAAKAGGACKKAGITSVVSSKTFTCVKSGNRLVWESKVTLPKFVPWSVPFNQNQELLAFRNNIDNWFKSNIRKNVDLEVYIDPKISPSGVPWISDALRFQAELIGLPSPASYKFYIGKTDKWVISKRKSVMPGLESHWNTEYVCYEGANEGCAGPTNREAFFVWTASSLLSPSEDWQFTRSLSHEFFHITQCDLIGDPRKCGEYFNMLPSWLAEGGPNVIGAIFMDRLGNLKYEDQRKFSLDLYKGGLHGANTPLASFSKNIRNGDLWPYEIGMLASEYLIASAGMQAFLDFYSNLPGTNSFEEAFQKSFGIPLNDFYVAFDKARVNLGFYPVSKN